jgi:putative peptidoglycan lipid II flippase
MLVATLLSRLLGLARDVVVSNYFGVSAFTDAYKAAFTLPDLCFFLIAGGALSCATVPIFSEYLERGQEEEAWKLFSIFAGGFALLLAIVVLAGLLLMAPIMALLVPGFRDDPAQMAVTVRLSRIVFPAQICFFVGGLITSALHVRNRFLAPAIGPICYNAGIIAGGVLGASLLGPEAGVEGLCWGVLAGAFAGNIVVQGLALRGAGIRYRPSLDWRHPGVRKAGRLMLPVVLGLSLPYVHALLARPFGSYLPVGSITWLDNANKVMQLPMTLFAHALGVALFPRFSALAARGDLGALRREVSRGLRALFFVTVPASLLIPVLAEPIVRLLFQWGRFTPADTHATAQATAFYALAIFAHSGAAIAARAFYALQVSAAPVVVGLLSTAVYLLLNLALMGPMGANGLALSMSIAAVVNLVGLLLLLERRIGGAELAAVARAGGRMGLAAGAAAGGAWLAVHLMTGQGDVLTVAGAVLRIALGGSAGGAAYLVTARFLRVAEVEIVWQRFARLKRRSSRGRGTR